MPMNKIIYALGVLLLASCQGSPEPEFPLIERGKGYPGYVKEIVSHVPEIESCTYKYGLDDVDKLYMIKSEVEGRFFTYSGGLTIKEENLKYGNVANSLDILYTRYDLLEFVPWSRAEAPGLALPPVPGPIREISYPEINNDLNIHSFEYLEAADKFYLAEEVRRQVHIHREGTGIDSVTIRRESRTNSWDTAGNIEKIGVEGLGHSDSYAYKVELTYYTGESAQDNSEPNVDINYLLFGPIGFQLELFGERTANRLHKIRHTNLSNPDVDPVEYEYSYEYDADGRLEKVARDGEPLYTIIYYDENGK